VIFGLDSGVERDRGRGRGGKGKADVTIETKMVTSWLEKKGPRRKKKSGEEKG